MSGGSGLGLSIVKAIIERHGGTVAVSSTQGVATVFEVVLPELESQQDREDALKQVGVIGEQLEQRRSIDA